MELGIILDGFRTNDEVELDISAIESMALPYLKEPVPVRVLGSAVPHDDVSWVINSITYGEALRKPDGRRVRQQMTLSMYGYQRPDRLQLRAAVNARKKVGK